MRAIERNALTMEGFGNRLKKDLFKNKSLYFMVLPVVIYYFLFCYIPMYGVIMAFQNFDPAYGVLKSPFVGLENFIDFFTGNYFLRILKNTFVISFSSLVFGFPIPIILALSINEIKSKKFLRGIQTITYLPHFISLMVLVGLIKDFTSADGIIGTIYASITGNEISMLSNPNLFVPIYVVSNVWQGMGWDSIIYFAALMGIDMQLYEACKIDGGGRIRQTISVTLPGILPTIIIMLILRLGNILSVGYEKIILMYSPLTYKTADVISTYVYRKGLQEFNWSYGTAVGLFNSVINIVFLLVANNISRKVSETSLW